MFSTFRLHQETKDAPWTVKRNPAPLAVEKVSLDYLCNFDFEQYVNADKEASQWLTGSNLKHVALMTEFLVDFVIVFTASSLSRYYLIAWNHILQAHKSPIYNDIRHAYRTVSLDAPWFFADQMPFTYSFGTRQS